jgi:predicted protein tyrosine phosphatase
MKSLQLSRRRAICFIFVTRVLHRQAIHTRENYLWLATKPKLDCHVAGLASVVCGAFCSEQIRVAQIIFVARNKIAASLSW